METFCDIPDGRLYYEIAGEGEPVILIHGFSLDHRMWRPQVDHFSKQFQVITYDARGFGKSSLPSGKYQHHTDLKALMDHLKLPSAHIVGLSMGGRIAANFTLTYPDHVRTLTLLDAAMNGYPNTVDWRVHAKEQGIAAAKQNWLHHQLFDFTNTQPAVAHACAEIVADYSGWHWLNHDQQSETRPHTRARLSEIQVPTLVVVGAHDLAQFRDIAASYHEGVRDSKFVQVAQAGHMVNLEAPDQINRLLEGHFVPA